uniref:Uncharacterized protein n=1 Tax=Sphaerodactylus townsendi TaxID=933632 RepID=A0ACB8FI47_9SAUR
MANKTRKGSVQEKPEMDSKLDHVLEAITNMQKESMEHFIKIEGKFSIMENNFGKMQEEIREIKQDLTLLKVMEKKVNNMEGQLVNLTESHKDMEQKQQDMDATMSKIWDQVALLELRQKENMLRFRGVIIEGEENITQLMMTQLAKYLDVDEEVMAEDISKE